MGHQRVPAQDAEGGGGGGGGRHTSNRDVSHRDSHGTEDRHVQSTTVFIQSEEEETLVREESGDVKERRAVRLNSEWTEE